MTLEDYFRTRLSQPGYDLFAVFSRFEYAMKKGGFRRNSSPDAAWDKFAEALPQDFFQKMKESDQAQIYFEAPPAHLIATDGGGVDWSKSPNIPTDARGLFRSIKTARNNLFHGDKKHDNNRDTQLMAAALFVLNEAFKHIEGQEEFSGFVPLWSLGYRLPASAQFIG